MIKRPKMRRIKKITITLSEKEGEWLSLYAQDLGISRPDVVRRLMREGLRQYKASRGGSVVPENQLELFDSIQVDIFNNTTKTEKLSEN
jgi:Mn-dependent DtxR family transcriptional regulator